jgi:hypothetical protein
MPVGANLMKCKKRASGIEHWAGTIVSGIHDDLHMRIVIAGEARKSTGHVFPVRG